MLFWLQKIKMNSKHIIHPSKEKNLYGIFNDSFPPILDGVTLTVENYVYWLKEKGKTPCVVTPWNPVRNDFPCEVLRFFSLPIYSRRPYRYGYPKLDPFIWRKIRESDFKIVHAHCPFSSGRLGVYAKKRKGIPLIGTFHSKYRDDLEHSMGYVPWMIDYIMGRIIDFYNACDEVWIPQAHVEETVREYGYKGKLIVMENGNDMASNIDGDIKEYKKSARKAVGIPEGNLSLLFVGQHIWEKGTDVIVETLRLLKGRIPFTMNFIGTGYAAGEIAERIREYGLDDCVKMNGVIEDRDLLGQYYAAADLFLFPSFYDNAPLVIREAAAMGTPAILLKGSTAGEVISDRNNGFLTEKSPEAFANLIEYLYKNPEMLYKAATGAHETLVKSWKKVVDEVLDRYDTLIAANERRVK